jgi:hypothetical protein
MKRMMKELMAKKKLTAKEKKLLIKMQKGGVWWNPFSWASDPTGPVDQATLTKQFDDLKGQICKVCKAAFGEDGCKCGNTVPPVEPVSNSGNSPVTELQENQSPSGEGDLAREETTSPSEEPQVQPQPEKKTSGGKSKSSKRANKRSKRASKKIKG